MILNVLLNLITSNCITPRIVCVKFKFWIACNATAHFCFTQQELVFCKNREKRKKERKKNKNCVRIEYKEKELFEKKS